MKKMRSFNDAHMHFVGIGVNKLEYVDISNSSSFQDLKETLQEEISREMIVARGWHQENFIEKSSITKELLNEVSLDTPIICIRTCGHVLVCNDAMMRLAEIDNSTSQVEGGTFNYNTGEFTENALELIYKHMKKPDKARIKEYMAAANIELLKNGVTACGSDDFSTLPVPYELIIEAYQEAYAEGLIDVRIYQQVNIPNYDELKDFINKGLHKLSFGRFKMGPLKLLADGSLGGRTAYMRDDYIDEPGNRGVATFTQQELDDLVYLADSNNMDVAIHGIGDACIDMILDSIEKSVSKTKRAHRHSIIHAQLANLEQINRMKELNVGAIIQPIFLNSDIPIIEPRLGERSKETYLFKTMNDVGLHVALSSDTPVEPLNPFYNLHCATTRQSIKHDLPPFLEEESYKLVVALRLYQDEPYYFSYEEKENYKDYIECQYSNNLTEVEVRNTYIDNVKVYPKKKSE